jgi:hypothetical protein
MLPRHKDTRRRTMLLDAEKYRPAGFEPVTSHQQTEEICRGRCAVDIYKRGSAFHAGRVLGGRHSRTSTTCRWPSACWESICPSLAFARAVIRQGAPLSEAEESHVKGPRDRPRKCCI